MQKKEEKKKGLFFDSFSYVFSDNDNIDFDTIKVSYENKEKRIGERWKIEEKRKMIIASARESNASRAYIYELRGRANLHRGFCPSSSPVWSRVQESIECTVLGCTPCITGLRDRNKEELNRSDLSFQRDAHDRGSLVVEQPSSSLIKISFPRVDFRETR